MHRIQVSRRFVSKLPPERLWPQVADTDWINRQAGFSHLEVEPLAGDGPARYRVRSRQGPVEAVWDELPTEWVENERYAFHRVFLRGPLREFRMWTSLERREEGCAVELRSEGIPRWPGTRWMVRRAMARALKQIADVLVRHEQSASTPAVPMQLAIAPRRTEAWTRARALLTERIDAALADRLAEWVATGPERDLVRIRPYALADAWGIPRDQVLAACLEAVQAGLLRLHWELLCPSCQAGSTSVEALHQLGESAHCGFCDLSFGVELDRSVEAVFTPNPAVREISTAPFCIAAPTRVPHVVSQALLPLEGRAELKAASAPGRYRLFVRGGAVASVEVSPGAPETAALRAGEVLAPVEVVVAPGGVLQVENAGAPARHVKLERLGWTDQAATAHAVSLLPAFRARFSSEVLRSGLSLSVSRVALLFTDLTGSTALYSSLGDAAAFQIVQAHFQVLSEIVARHRGVVVKTIGDALMAAFEDDAQAVRCGLELLAAYGRFRQAQSAARATELKVGVYAGPSYVVTSNGQLDYFGQTVNLAARLQGAAGPSELVLSADAAARALASGILSADAIRQRFDAALKGIDAPVPCVRIGAARVASAA